MFRTRVLIAACCWLSLVGGSQAAELTLNFRAVTHTTEVNELSVPGQPDHKLGVVAFRGLAILDGDRIANHAYSGSFDFVKGSGPIRGYAFWVFEDGSRLEAAYVGEAKTAPNGGITFSAKYDNVAGTGRYAGFTGSGTFAGRRVDYFKQGGDTYFRGSLKLRSDTK